MFSFGYKVASAKSTKIVGFLSILAKTCSPKPTKRLLKFGSLDQFVIHNNSTPEVISFNSSIDILLNKLSQLTSTKLALLFYINLPSSNSKAPVLPGSAMVTILEHCWLNSLKAPSMLSAPRAPM